MNDYAAGSTSIVETIFLQDSTSTVGAGKTGLVFNTASLTCYYKRSNGTASVAVSLVTITTLGTFASGGFKEIDATNQPGLYEFHPPDAAFASGAKHVTFFFVGATGLVARPIKVRVLAINPDDAVRGGMTALPNAAAAAANGLMVLGVNATAASFTAGLTISNASGDALVLTSSGSNGNGLNASGNGTADGIHAIGGATGRGIHAIGGATSGAGIRCEGTGGNSLGIHGLGTGTGAGMRFEGGISGPGAAFIGGSTSGDGIDITTSVGDGLSILPNGGNAVTLVGNGTSKHGLSITGGTGGTSDGIHAVAGTGGVDIRGNITGNLAGTVTTTTTLTNLPVIPANWLTATGIAATALNGKGDWSTYVGPAHFTNSTFSADGVFAPAALANTPAPSSTVNANVIQVLGVGVTPLTLVNGGVPSSLVSAGLDQILIESGLNARQALAIISSILAGVLAGATTTTVTTQAAGVPATNRLSATVDSSGNRTAVTLHPPA